ncbi:MAG: M10 family metallopeptidase [Pseudomonadota bacterium]
MCIICELEMAGIELGDNSLQNNNYKNFSYNNSIGILSDDKLEGTPEQYADQLNSFRFSRQDFSNQNVITYSFDSGFSAAERAAMEDAIQYWDDLIAVDFVESNSRNTNIFFDSVSSGYASAGNGSINLNTSRYNWDVEAGDYQFSTIVHEIGHGLGLAHAGNYNGSANFDREAVLANDSYQMTLMSYFSVDENPYVSVDNPNSRPAAPMIMDIYAIQDAYALETTTRTDNTVYGFNSTADRDAFDFTKTDPYTSLYDAGGIDTLDISEYSYNQNISLISGTFSDIGGWEQNVSIAYSTTIENAIGGSGNDIFTGNSADNFIDGGAGMDTLFLNGNFDAYTFEIDANGQATIISTQNGNDTIENIELFEFSDGTVTYDTLVAAAEEGNTTPSVPNTTENPTLPQTISFTGSEGTDPSAEYILTLIDASQDVVIGTIEDGDQIDADLFEDQSITIAVMQSDDSIDLQDVESARFDLNNGMYVKTESFAPYALLGDDLEGDYAGALFSKGNYDLNVKLYSENRLEGNIVNEIDVNFSIVDDVSF